MLRLPSCLLPPLPPTKGRYFTLTTNSPSFASPSLKSVQEEQSSIPSQKQSHTPTTSSTNRHPQANKDKLHATTITTRLALRVQVAQLSACTPEHSAKIPTPAPDDFTFQSSQRDGPSPASNNFYNGRSLKDVPTEPASPMQPSYANSRRSERSSSTPTNTPTSTLQNYKSTLPNHHSSKIGKTRTTSTCPSTRSTQNHPTKRKYKPNQNMTFSISVPATWEQQQKAHKQSNK